MRKALVAAAIACLCWSGPAAAGSACFAPDEASAAYLRALQQDFNVAALSCATATPGELVADYNRFVDRFGDLLRDNARALREHFARAGGEVRLDSWMTQVANASAIRLASDADFCPRTARNLEIAITMEGAALLDLAAAEGAGASSVPLCSARKMAASPPLIAPVE